MENSKPDHSIKNAAQSPPKTKAGWIELSEKIKALSRSAQLIDLKQLVALAHHLDSCLTSPQPLAKDPEMQLLAYSIWSIILKNYYLQTGTGWFAGDVAILLKPEAILLNMLNHVLVIDDRVRIEKVLGRLEYHKGIFKRANATKRLEKLEKELAAATAVRHIVQSKPGGLEKIGYRIERALDGSFIIHSPKNAKADFPLNAFCETLRLFIHEGSQGDRLVNKLLEALGPHVKEIRDPSPLRTALSALYPDNAGSALFDLFEFSVLTDFKMDPSNYRKIGMKLFAGKKDNQLMVVRKHFDVIDKIPYEDTKAAALELVFFMLEVNADNDFYLEAAVRAIKAALSLSDQNKAAKMLASLVFGPSAYTYLAQSAFRDLRTEQAKIEFLLAVVEMLNQSEFFLKDGYQFALENCGKVDQAQASLALLPMLVQHATLHLNPHDDAVIELLAAIHRIQDPQRQTELQQQLEKGFRDQISAVEEEGV